MSTNNTIITVSITIQDVPEAAAYPGVDRRVSIDVQYGEGASSFRVLDNPDAQTLSLAVADSMVGRMRTVLAQTPPAGT